MYTRARSLACVYKYLCIMYVGLCDIIYWYYGVEIRRILF